MRLVRRALNGLLRSTVLDEDSLPITLRVLTASSALLRFGGLFKVDLNSRYAVPQALSIMAKAIVSTPYNEPLIFDTPLLMSVDVTSFCPLACPICYSDSHPHQSPEAMPLRLVEEIASSPVPTILLTGGEPLVLGNLSTILDRLVGADKNVLVATNDTSTRVNELAERYRSRVTLLYSLYGAQRAHDFYRGAGSYARLKDKIREVNDLGGRIRLNCVVQGDPSETLGALESDFLSCDFDVIYISRPIQVGRRPEKIHQVSPESLRPLVDRLRRNTKTPIVVTLPGYNNWQELSWLTRQMLEWVGIPGLAGSCGAGNWVVHVTRDGLVKPCFAFGAQQTSVAPNESSRPDQKLGKCRAECCSQREDHGVGTMEIPRWTPMRLKQLS